MENIEILKKLQEIFCDILDNEEIKLSRETTVNDIDEWDSLTNIQLVVAIEKSFKIKFTSKEIITWKNIGEMIDCIIQK